MQQLWSPWRSQYIQSFKETGGEPRDDVCFLCEAYQQTGRDRELLVVARFDTCFAIMNRFPYNSGHLMIVPNRHIGKLAHCEAHELSELMLRIQQATRVLETVFQPHGINVGANMGRSAGAGVPDHIHFHLVPRWNGDTNFMPILADVKVVSDSMEENWEKLSEEFRRFQADTPSQGTGRD